MFLAPFDQHIQRWVAPRGLFDFITGDEPVELREVLTTEMVGEICSARVKMLKS